MEELHSEADNIEFLAQSILHAFKDMEVQEGQVLQYSQLYPYLQEHYPKYKDVQKEAEHHLSKSALINPAPDGLMLTQVGARRIYEGK
ncbi:hypothetical protein [Pontibacter harenae]|uniref:hypothetical protein n=1 Tax=Pontibacter harenae TaxID=2894083 RepID=UPI001E36E660|nr:hypothetical protein [Pontibacter harenae]MCC9166049.1 hypothetical protein [Pontibacter harenae]